MVRASTELLCRHAQDRAEKGRCLMHDHVVESRSDSGVGTGLVLGIVVILLVGVVALFFIFGGPRTAGPAPGPSNTNLNVPAQQAPPAQQPNSGPNIQVPRQIDVNVNQPGGGQAPAPQNPAPQNQAPAPAGQ